MFGSRGNPKRRRRSQQLSMLSAAPTSGRKKKRSKSGRSGIKRHKGNIKRLNMIKCTASVPKQMFLDFGQQNFGARSCPKCGMVFSRGKKEDEELHSAYCKSRSKPIAFRSKQTQFIVSRIDSSSSVWMIHGPLSKARVECLYLAEKYVEAKRVMDASMGFGSGGTGEKWTAFFYVFENTLAGVLVTERIAQAHAIDERYEGDRAFPKAERLESSSLRRVETPSAATLGIVQIWVDESRRRKGVASVLVDTARRHAVYGHIVPKKMCAMTQPTAEGRAFGESYFGTPLLVY